MTIWVDTNILLDVLCNRSLFADDSVKIWKLCETRQTIGYVSSLSWLNVAYILRKELTPERTTEILRQLSCIFTFVDLKADDLFKAGDFFFSDYKDAVQVAGASRLKVDYIITRNVGDYSKSPITAITPSDFLKLRK